MEPDTGDLLHRGLRELRVHCQRCPVTFLSPINYCRHNKVKHAKHGKKSTGSSNTKEKLEDFWNTLQVEQQKEVLSVEGDAVAAEVKVPGAFVKKNLEQFTKKYKLKIRLASERQIQDSESNYLMAASQLLDIVDARPSRFPITVNELFSIMDKASEGTFLLGELSSVEWSKFEKNEAIELIDVVARTSFILEKQLLDKEREYSKVLMQSLEEKANAVAQKLIEEEDANNSQKTKKKKEKKQGQIKNQTQSPAAPTEPTGETPQPIEQTGETPKPVEPSNENYEVGETRNEQWNKIVGGRTILDRVRSIPILSLYTTRMLSDMKMEIPVWDKDRFQSVYLKMLRDIIIIIRRLEKKGIRNGNLRDKEIQIIAGKNLEEQQTRILNDIEANRDSKLRVELKNLVSRLQQWDRDQQKDIPEELAHFLELISREISGELLEQLLFHPWLMTIMERYYFPFRCWVQLMYKLRDSWKPRFRKKTAPGFDLPSEVGKMEDRFQKIYKEGSYENNVVGVLEYCKNVILHFGENSKKDGSVQEYVHGVLSKHFPDLMLDLFEFFVEQNINLDFKFDDELAKTVIPSDK